MEAYSSFLNFMNFKRSAIEVGSVYKRYALLFDRVIFNRHGCPIGRVEAFETLPEFIANLSLNDRTKASTLGKNKRFGELFVDLWDVIENPEQVDKDVRDYVTVEDGNNISILQILELRSDKHIREFRRKVFACSDGSQPIDMVLSNELEKDLWSLANDCKPNLGATVIEGFLSNLLLPTPINPFGWYYAAKSIARDYRRGKEKGWVYFVQSMKKLS